MGNYPDVVPGDKVSFNANRENEINRMLNAGGGFKDGIVLGKTTPQVRIQVWNDTNSTLIAGQIVQIKITGSTMCGEAFPCDVFRGDPDVPFGVLTKLLDANEMGDCVLSGLATVELSGGTAGNYAKPLINGKATRGDEGLRILNISGGTNAIVLLGEYHYAAGTNVTISGMTINCSGGTAGAGVTSISAGTDNVTIDPASGTGDVTISVEDGGGGGTGGFFPVWGHNGHTAVLAPTSSDSGDISYTPERDGYLFACAYFDPFADGFRHTRYDAHVNINGGKMKVCELRLGSASNLFIKNYFNEQFNRSPADDFSNRILVNVDVYDEEHDVYVKKQYYRDTSEDYQDPDTGNYTYFGWYSANYYSLGPSVVYTKEWHLTPASLSEDDDVYTKDDSGEVPSFDYYGSCSLIPNYTYFAWKSGNTVKYTDTCDVIPMETYIYVPNEHGVFEHTDEVTATNTAAVSAVGVGAGQTIPFHAGSTIRFVVRADNSAFYVRDGIPSCFCVIYEKPAPTPTEEEPAEEED